MQKFILKQVSQIKVYAKFFFHQESSSPEVHAEYVWRNYISPHLKTNGGEISRVAIVAHSYGGCVVLHLVSFIISLICKDN